VIYVTLIPAKMGLLANHCQTEILNASVRQGFMGRHAPKSSTPATVILVSMMPNVKCSKLDAFYASVPQDFLGLDAKLTWTTALTIGVKTMVPALTKLENTSAGANQDLKDAIVRKK